LFGKLENKSFLELNSIEIKQLPESSITISVATIENQIQKIKNSSWNKFKVKCNHFDQENIKSLLQMNYDIALDSNGSFNEENCIWLQNEMASEKFSYLEQPMKKALNIIPFYSLINMLIGWPTKIVKMKLH